MAIIEQTDNDWGTEPTAISQTLPLLGKFRSEVSAAGTHGKYAGVLIEASGHASITNARETAYRILAAADIAEQQAVAEVHSSAPVFSDVAR